MTSRSCDWTQDTKIQFVSCYGKELIFDEFVNLEPVKRVHYV